MMERGGRKRGREGGRGRGSAAACSPVTMVMHAARKKGGEGGKEEELRPLHLSVGILALYKSTNCAE